MRTFLFLVFSLYAVTGCAQSKPSIRIAGVFADIKYPGNIPVDDNGRPLKSGPDTAFHMVVETGKEAVKWGYVFYNDKVYTVIPTQLRKPYEARAKESGGRTLIKPAKGKLLWQLELVPFNEYRKAPDTLRRNNFMLQVKYGKASFRLVKQGFIEIITPPSV